MKNPSKPGDIFGESIFTYTRKQAIADGVLVDVSDVAKEVGFRIPVALTSAAWAEYVVWAEADNNHQIYQDESARIWDVLWIGLLGARKNREASKIIFQLYCIPRDSQTTTPRLMTLHMLCGPGDKGEPVLTIMTPDED